MTRESRGPLARWTRLGKYLIEDAGGILADVAYALRDAFGRRRSARRMGRRRGRVRQHAHRRGGA
jgi:hypothetical protein